MTTGGLFNTQVGPETTGLPSQYTSHTSFTPARADTYGGVPNAEEYIQPPEIVTNTEPGFAGYLMQNIGGPAVKSVITGGLLAAQGSDTVSDFRDYRQMRKDELGDDWKFRDNFSAETHDDFNDFRDFQKMKADATGTDIADRFSQEHYSDFKDFQDFQKMKGDSTASPLEGADRFDPKEYKDFADFNDYQKTNAAVEDLDLSKAKDYSDSSKYGDFQKFQNHADSITGESDSFHHLGEKEQRQALEHYKNFSSGHDVKTFDGTLHPSDPHKSIGNNVVHQDPSGNLWDSATKEHIGHIDSKTGNIHLIDKNSGSWQGWFP